MMKRCAILFVNVSLMISFKLFTTTFLSLASRMLKTAHATYRPYFEANKVGKFSLSASARFFSTSISVDVLNFINER
jgi:hypothetical protein